MRAGLDPGRTYSLAEVFGGLRSPVRPGHDYFIAAPPLTLQVDPARQQALEVRRPFFIDHGWSFGPDQDLVPFVWDPASGGQPRFSEAEALTDYDSGSFGLAAVSASDAEGQAQVYTLLGRAIVEVHQSNRDLLAEWLDAQGPHSREAFIYFDRERVPAEEKLLATDGSIDREVWGARLEELATCLDTGAFRKHHFRWIELLAHSVDIPGLMRLIQAAER